MKAPTYRDSTCTPTYIAHPAIPTIHTGHAARILANAVFPGRAKNDAARMSNAAYRSSMRTRLSSYRPLSDSPIWRFKAKRGNTPSIHSDGSKRRGWVTRDDLPKTYTEGEENTSVGGCANAPAPWPGCSMYQPPAEPARSTLTR